MSQQEYADSLQRLSSLILRGDMLVEPYRDNYVGVHASALANTYLFTAELLGENAFSALSNVYAQHYPTDYWDLNLYGVSLPGFLLAQHNGPRGTDYNWSLISEIAHLEYLIAQQYYADLDLLSGGEKLCLEVDEIANLKEEHFSHFNKLHPYTQISPEVIGARQIYIWREGIKVVLTAADNN